MTKEQQAVIDAVMLCDFSEIFEKKFTSGESTFGLAAIVQAKQALVRNDPLERNDRLRRRAIAQLEQCEVTRALKTLQQIKK